MKIYEKITNKEDGSTIIKTNFLPIIILWFIGVIMCAFITEANNSKGNYTRKEQLYKSIDSLTYCAGYKQGQLDYAKEGRFGTPTYKD